MKKTISILIALIIALALSACGNADVSVGSDSRTDTPPGSGAQTNDPTMSPENSGQNPGTPDDQPDSSLSGNAQANIPTISPENSGQNPGTSDDNAQALTGVMQFSTDSLILETPDGWAVNLNVINESGAETMRIKGFDDDGAELVIEIVYYPDDADADEYLEAVKRSLVFFYPDIQELPEEIIGDIIWARMYSEKDRDDATILLKTYYTMFDNRLLFVSFKFFPDDNPDIPRILSSLKLK